MATVEQEIIEALDQLDLGRKRAVLTYIRQLAHPSPRELMKLPRAERYRYLQPSFQLAEQEDFEMFEAYLEENLDD